MSRTTCHGPKSLRDGCDQPDWMVILVLRKGNLPTHYLSICLSICLSIYVSINLSIYVSKNILIIYSTSVPDSATTIMTLLKTGRVPKMALPWRPWPSGSWVELQRWGASSRMAWHILLWDRQGKMSGVGSKNLQLSHQFEKWKTNCLNKNWKHSCDSCIPWVVILSCMDNQLSFRFRMIPFLYVKHHSPPLNPVNSSNQSTSNGQWS